MWLKSLFSKSQSRSPEKPEKASKEMSGGCLSLFGLPFLAGGLLVTSAYFMPYFEWMEVQNWEKAPCVIYEVGMESGSDSDTQHVTARYGYDYDGRGYIGTRVSLYEGSDNIGSFHSRTFDELSAFKDSGGFECYVNPEAPDESILYNLLRWEMQCFMAVFALTFPAVGAGLVFGGILARRAEKREQALIKAHADEPWKAKPNWQDSTIPESIGKWWLALHAYTLWAAVIIIPLIGFTAASGCYQQSPLAWLSLIYVVLWMVPAWFSVKRWRNYRLTGPTQFQPDSDHFHPGGQLEGTIIMKRAPYLREPMEIALSCTKSITVAGSDGDETRTDKIWEERVTVPMHELGRDIDGTRIPVRIPIPHDAPDSGKQSDGEETEFDWALSYMVAGTPISGEFEIPVFRTEDQKASTEPMDPMDSIGSKSPSIHDHASENLQLKLRDCRIRSEFDPDHIPTHIICPRCRRPGMLVFMVLFNLVWSIAAVYLVIADIPLFNIIWPVTAGLIWLQILWMMLHKRETNISGDVLQVSNLIGPIAWVQNFQKSDIKGFDYRLAKNSGNSAIYNVRLLKQARGKCTLVDNIRSSSTAEALISRLEAWHQRD